MDAGAEALTMEVSSHEFGRLRGVEFDVAIFKFNTRSLDFHGTMEAYGHAKSLLFSQLGEIYLKKYVVLNNDDAFLNI